MSFYRFYLLLLVWLSLMKDNDCKYSLPIRRYQFGYSKQSIDIFLFYKKGYSLISSLCASHTTFQNSLKYWISWYLPHQGNNCCHNWNKCNFNTLEYKRYSISYRFLSYSYCLFVSKIKILKPLEFAIQKLRILTGLKFPIQFAAVI